MLYEVITYNIGGYVEIKGKIDPDMFQQAMNVLISQNDALCIIILEKDGKPFQKFLPELNYPVLVYDFSNEQNSIEYSKAWVNKEMIKPFCINENILFDTCLIKVKEELFYWFFKCHHLITDVITSYSIHYTKLYEYLE